MNGSTVKKNLILCILDVLKKYSDEDHRLSQKDICDILKNEYGVCAERKSIKRNVMELMDFGYDIEYTSCSRGTVSGDESECWSGFYLVRDFDDSELRLLIDSIIFSRHIPAKQRLELTDKLAGLSNKYFSPRVKHIKKALEGEENRNNQLFYTVDVIDEAINEGRQVEFTYNEYGIDKKPRPRKNEDGEIRKYVINPYQIAAVNGRYYLICNNDKYDTLSNYRLDRISNIRLLDAPRKDVRELKGCENGFELPRHMAEHIYMFQGESVHVRFRVRKNMIAEVIDWFGDDVELKNDGEEYAKAAVYVNFEAMRRWALQFALDVQITSPKKLVDAVKSDVEEAAAKYGVK